MKHFIKITLLLVLITYPEWAVASNGNLAPFSAMVRHHLIWIVQYAEAMQLKHQENGMVSAILIYN